MRTCSNATVCGLPSGRKALRLLHSLTFGTEACPACAGRLNYRKAYAWCPACRRKVRAKAASWLRGSKLSPRQLLELLLAWQRKQAPGACAALLGLSYPTVRRWYARFRERLPEAGGRLAGPAEANESFFGRRRFGNQALVAGVLERGGQVRLSQVQDRGSFSLVPFLLRNLEEGSLLLTDAHAGYGEAERHYPRMTRDHARGDYGSTAGVENVWSRCKRQLRRQYGAFYPFHLKGLLREWEARHNFPELFTDPAAYLERCLVPHSFT